jgi:hypothetical protein
VFGRLFFALGFRREFTEMFHHGVGIDLADRAEFFLRFVFVLGFGLIFVFVLGLHLVFRFVLVLFFAFPEQTAGDVAEGTQPALAFQACLFLHLVFHLVFEFTFELVF